MSEKLQAAYLWDYVALLTGAENGGQLFKIFGGISLYPAASFFRTYWYVFWFLSVFFSTTAKLTSGPEIIS